MRGTKAVAIVVSIAICALLVSAPSAVASYRPASSASASIPGSGATQTPSSGFVATGFFHTAYVNGRWWLVTPDGKPFYSSGIDHVSSNPDTDQKTGQCPYCNAIASDYPSISAWATTQVSRLRGWGFNTLGAFSDTSGTDGAIFTSSMPFTLLLNMASGSDWFSQDFATHAQQVAQQQCAPLANDPNLVGYFLDSEIHWGPDWRSTKPLLDDYLSLPPGSPGLAVAQRYVGNPNGFLFALATRYFQVTTAAIREADPHHLILGVKAVSQLTQPELLEAAAPYVDVWSVDDYQLTPAFTQLIDGLWPYYLEGPDLLAKIESYVHKPLMISEYSFRAADSGLTNSWPPIYPTYATQGQRAAQYQAYVEKLYSDGFVVGDDWFEYVDEPYNGRFDGEDSNFGILSTADKPYMTMITRMEDVHAMAPDRMIDSGPYCLSWAAVSTPITGAQDVTCATTTNSTGVVSDLGYGFGNGYWTFDSRGEEQAFGEVADFGSPSGLHLDAPIVAMASTPDENGYWEVASDGGVFTFGDAGFYGSLGGSPLAAPIVGIAASPSGGGYWLVGADGGVFTFGDAGYFGSLGHLHLAAPVVAIAATPDGGGYWLVGADGGVFTFGDAGFYGALPDATALNGPLDGSPNASPIVGIAPTPDGGGYWMVDSYGSVYAFGDAEPLPPANYCNSSGCTGSGTVPTPVVGIAAAPYGGGYWLASADGVVTPVGTAARAGIYSTDTATWPFLNPIVGIAA